MKDSQKVAKVVAHCLKNGLILFWFLSHPNSFRIAPPLTISENEILKASEIILEAIQEKYLNIFLISTLVFFTFTL